MLNKETFKKEFVRMMDNMRNTYKGREGCVEVNCLQCPLRIYCFGDPTMTTINAFEIIEAVEKWAKEHPIITNEIKLKETFGDVNFLIMDPDSYDEWRKQEYKEPEKEKK